MGMISRREFIKRTATASAFAGMGGFSMNVMGANERIVVGVMGLKGRGGYLAQEFAKRPDVEVRYLADPDTRLFADRTKGIEQITGKAPQCLPDFRKMLEDPEVNAIVMGTPDHWHALGTILACQAGKDVYVEKPTSHNIWESRKMIEAARKYNRVVQVGAQCRSGEYIQAAYEYIHSAAFGEMHYARVLNSKPRTSIGNQPDKETPEGVDYDMWLGPAPLRKFNENHFHYAWHWFWAYSGGDIINDGVHQMDIARWMIDKTYPQKVCSGGGCLYFKDDQETPDTHTATWDFDGFTMAFEQTLWTPYMNKTPLEVRDIDGLPNWPFNGTRIEIFGSKQILFLGRHGDGWEAFDADGKSVASLTSKFSTVNEAHFQNFLDCIRSRKEPNADIEKLHYSTLLCHYANIAYRTGRVVHIDPKTEGFVNDDEANALVKRQGREPWIVPETV